MVRDAESEYLELMQDQKDAMGAILGARTDTSDRSYRLHSVQMQGAEPSTKSLTLLTVPVRTEPRKGSDLVRQPGRIIASIQGPDVIPDASDRSDPEATGTRSERGPLIRLPPADFLMLHASNSWMRSRSEEVTGNSQG